MQRVVERKREGKLCSSGYGALGWNWKVEWGIVARWRGRLRLESWLYPFQPIAFDD
jgi:hypothetical protein